MLLLLFAAIFVLWIWYVRRLQAELALKELEKDQDRQDGHWHRHRPTIGFPHGGFTVGPWVLNRQQHYFHPGVGWYSSPFFL